MNMKKQEWKLFYRLLRIHRREFEKDMVNQLVYGIGAVFYPVDGIPFALSPREIREFETQKNAILGKA